MASHFAATFLAFLADSVAAVKTDVVTKSARLEVVGSFGHEIRRVKLKT